MACDGYFYWKHWTDYLNAATDENLAAFHDTGNMVMKTKLNDGLRKQLTHLDALGIPYEHWSRERIAEPGFPFYDLTSYAPAKRLDDPDFGTPTGGTVDGAVFFPNGGYNLGSATRHAEHPAGGPEGRRGVSSSIGAWWRSPPGEIACRASSWTTGAASRPRSW